MRLSTQELTEMHEVLHESVCMIGHYAMYLSHCQDPELRRILERQQRHMIDSYNAKVNVSQSQGIDISGISRPAMAIQTAGKPVEGRPEYSVPHVPPGIGGPEAAPLNDRAIATGAALFHKYGAVKSTEAAFVCTDPQLRNFLSTGARSCVEMAFELSQYMNQKGWHSVPTAQQHTTAQTQQTYQTQAGH